MRPENVRDKTPRVIEYAKVHIPSQAVTMTAKTDQKTEAVKKMFRRELAELCGKSDAPIPLDDSVSTTSAGDILGMTMK